MDISQLKRNPEAVKKTLKEVDGVLHVTQPTKVYIPVRFAERELAQISTDIYIIGVCAVVIKDSFYSVMMINAMMRILPSTYQIVTIDETEYYEFYFEPGSVFVPNMQLVKKDTLVYRIYDEIISKGNIPWYLTYLDLGGLFDTARHHAGTNICDNREVTELIASLIARDKKDRTKYYRQAVKSQEDVLTKPPAYISMRSVIYAATNTLNKLAGSYMEDGMVSALVSPSTRQERIENLLTK